MADIRDATKTKSFVDDLLDGLEESTPKVVEITVKGKLLNFEVKSDAEWFAEFEQGANDFADNCSKKMGGKFAELTPCSRKTAAEAFLLSELSMEPNKLTHYDALRIARKSAVLFRTIISALNEATQIEISKREHNGVEEAKNASSGTPGLEIA